VAKLRGGILAAQELDRHAKDMVGLVLYAFSPLPRLPYEALCMFVHGWTASSASLIYFSLTTEGSRFEVVPPPEVRPMCCIPSLMSGHDQVVLALLFPQSYSAFIWNLEESSLGSRRRGHGVMHYTAFIMALLPVVLVNAAS
jgi:hypothetical protein